MDSGWKAFKILFWIGSAILIALLLLMIYFPLLLAKGIADYWGMDVWGLYGAVRQIKLGLLFLSMIYLLVSTSIILYHIKKGQIQGKEREEGEKEKRKEEARTFVIKRKKQLLSVGLTLVTGFILLEFGGDLLYASILAGLEGEKIIKPFLYGLLLISFTILLFLGSFEAYREQYVRGGVLTLVGIVGAIIFFLRPLIPQEGENVGLFAFLGFRIFPFFQLWMGVLAGILMLDCKYHFLEDVLRWLGIKKVECPHCGTLNPYDAIYCKKCGKVIQKKEEETKEKERDNGSQGESETA